MAKKNKIQILLVEDDPNLGMLIEDYLEMLGYSVSLCQDGEEGWESFKSNQYNLCLLDVMMPKKDGFTLAHQIRKINPAIPIIFLTAKSLKEDKIKGFKIGCDDYICKPFNTEELSLRIEAIMKRCQSGFVGGVNNDQETYHFGHFIFDFSNMLLLFGERKQKLTKKEAKLLKMLCIHKNKLIRREELLENIWGENDYFFGRSMDVFITKLRKYLQFDKNVQITNVHGTGFKLEIQDSK
ncbi:MAG: response regulator transcription factor [Bacteroidales bacterium]